MEGTALRGREPRAAATAFLPLKRARPAAGLSSHQISVAQQEIRNNSPPSWIKEGMELHAVSSSRELPRKGKVTHGPYEDFDKKWKVLLQFPEDNNDHERRILMEEEVVECCYCSQTCPVTQPLGCESVLGHLSNEEARQRATKYLRMMTSGKEYYAPELLEKAIDSAGFPFGLQDVMRKVHEMADHAKLLDAASEWDKGPGTFKVKTGMNIRRCWYDGLAYNGHVASAKPSEQFIDEKWQAAYAIEYDNGESDLFTEQEVRMRRYPRPEMPSVLGRKFNFLELFSGARSKVLIVHEAC